MAHGVIVT